MGEQTTRAEAPGGQSGDRVSVFRAEFLPFASLLFAMLIGTVAIDVVLNELGLRRTERYLGIAGSVLVALSFLYSFRKRNILRFGSIKYFLGFHEVCAWLGALLILVHSGTHFNGILAWLATLAMFVAVISGLTGRVVLQRARKQLVQRREFFMRQGKTEDEAEKEVLWEALAVDAMAKWRKAHLPVMWAVCILAGIHIFVALMFWARL